MGEAEARRADHFWALVLCLSECLCEHFSPRNCLNPPAALGGKHSGSYRPQSLGEPYVTALEFPGSNLSSTTYCSGTLDK